MKNSNLRRTSPVWLGFAFISFFALLCSGSDISRSSTVRIGISKASPNYVRWIHRSDTTAETVDLYSLPIAEAVAKLATCSALLVTGGEDVYPAWYSRIADTASCTGFDRRRDTLEMKLIAKALELHMPIFGICRGHQILNVYFGGSLYVDIPSEIPQHQTHQCEDYLHCFHNTYVEHGSLLATISKTDSALVTTNHHQAVRIPANSLRVSAYSDDKVIEAMEWQEPNAKSFLLSVQWHPERMEKSNRLSGPLADQFIEKAHEFELVTQKQMKK